MTMDEKYRDELMIALRVHEISGERVGEVLAEVETHVADTGEDPARAFGPPREYAARVASWLDPGTGKRSRRNKVGNALGTAALTLFGLRFLLDGVWPEGSATAFTQADVLSSVLIIPLIVVGVFGLLKASTAIPHSRVYGAVGIGGFVGMIATFVLTDQLADDEAALVELSPWISIAAGVVLLAGAVAMLVRSVRYGRVVDPR